MTDWSAILDHATEIVTSYETGVTLRQLFYRLVAAEMLPNTQNAYKGLSAHTAEARRRSGFPALIDRGRSIYQHPQFISASTAQHWLASIYRQDRTIGQAVSLYLGVEKNGIVEQLMAWFGDLGIPVLALGGYASQSYVEEVKAAVQEQDRRAVLIYAGDFDPSGEDIDRDFLARTGCFSDVIRVALTADQVTDYRLPPQPGKSSDSRSSQFIARHGRLIQVELDALPPDVLRQLYAAAIADYWDDEAYAEVLALEATERERLAR